MKNLKQDLKPTAAVNGGWAVHVYDGDRHLRCTLDPSHSPHSRAFGFGLVSGIIAAVIGANLALPANSSVADSPPAPTSSLPTASSRYLARYLERDSKSWID